jgi:hypothetical protein
LFVILSALLITFLLGFPADSQARNNYNYTDSSEGDPGDGVLRPKPQIEPVPEIEVRTFGIEFSTILFAPHADGRPNLLLPLLFFGPDPLWSVVTDSWGGHRVGRIPSEGGWTHAP